MNDLNSLEKVKAIKSKIQSFIEEGHLDESRKLLDQLDEFLPRDTDVCSMRAIVYILEGSLLEAELLLLEGLKNDSVQFDLLFNLAYINELKEQYQNAADLYYKASTAAVTEDQLENITKSLERVLLNDCSIEFKTKVKITIFVKEGMDNFLSDIIKELDEDYWIRKIVINNYNQINDGMEWADICWFEWCDELVAYGSKQHLAKVKKIICRLHSYEAFTEYIDKTDWEQVDKVIFIAEHIRDFVLGKQKLLRPEQTVIIPNGIDMEKFTFIQREPGYNIAYVGYINYKKGLMLLLQTFKALYDKDRRYKLYIAGIFQDEREKLYYNQMIKEFDIEENIVFDGWQNDLNQWMEDKNYILCTSILESQNISVMQAMCKGIKPVIHNFVGAKGVFQEKYIWNTIDEAVSMILNGKYTSLEYREYISRHFSLDNQMNEIMDMMKDLSSNRKTLAKVDDVLSGREFPEDLKIENLTILVPCYNRALMVKEDLDKGYNFPSQPKLLVDDFSDESDRKVLNELLKEREHYGITDIVFHDENVGVAAAYNSGVHATGTRYLLAKGDDDLILGNGLSETLNEILPSIGTDYVFITPRYIVNYSENNETSIGYDKVTFKNLGAPQILRHLFLTGEMCGFNAGTVYLREDLISCLPEPIFKVSEDYVTVSRVLAMRLELRINVSESITYIRRINNNSLSRTINESKLSLNILSMMVSGFYCMKNGLVNQSEFFDAFINREELLCNLYNFKKGLADIIIEYSKGNLKIEDFISYLKSRELSINVVDDLPKEVIRLPRLFN